MVTTPLFTRPDPVTVSVCVASTFTSAVLVTDASVAPPMSTSTVPPPEDSRRPSSSDAFLKLTAAPVPSATTRPVAAFWVTAVRPERSQPGPGGCAEDVIVVDRRAVDYERREPRGRYSTFDHPVVRHRDVHAARAADGVGGGVRERIIAVGRDRRIRGGRSVQDDRAAAEQAKGKWRSGRAIERDSSVRSGPLRVDGDGAVVCEIAFAEAQRVAAEDVEHSRRLHRDRTRPRR